MSETTAANHSHSLALGDALGPWDEGQAITARDTLLEILDIARHLLEHGPDRNCRRIAVSVGGVKLEAEFYPNAPEVADEDDKPEIRQDAAITPYNLPFPGEKHRT